MVRHSIHILLFLIPFLLGNGIGTLNELSSHQNGTIPDYVKRKMDRDAARLAILEGKGELSLKSIHIPKELKETYFKILMAIYLDDSAEADKIRDCGISASSTTPIDKFKLVFSKDMDWGQKFEEFGELDEEVDFFDLMEEYELTPTNHLNWNEKQEAFVMESVALYNMSALATKFSSFEGVEGIEFENDFAGDREDITIESTSNGWNVSFIRKWSKLGSDQLKSHKWTFHVTPDMKVSFVGESGDELPDYLKCELGPKQYSGRH